jgi:hypothetical protein
MLPTATSRISVPRIHSSEVFPVLHVDPHQSTRHTGPVVDGLP